MPEWYIEAITSDEDPVIVNKEMRKKCWITDEMSQEIRHYYPTREEMHIDKVLGDCTRDLEAFSRKCEALFPEGRTFMSYVQFVQAAKHFLERWNCKKVCGSFKITCFYSEGRKSNKYISKCEPCKRRKTVPSLKTQYKCPFEIRYAYLKIDKQDKKQASYYKVKIIRCNYNHTFLHLHLFHNLLSIYVVPQNILSFTYARPK